MFLTVLPACWIPLWMASSKPSGDSELISMIFATDMGSLLSSCLYPTDLAALDTPERVGPTPTPPAGAPGARPAQHGSLPRTSGPGGDHGKAAQHHRARLRSDRPGGSPDPQARPPVGALLSGPGELLRDRPGARPPSPDRRAVQGPGRRADARLRAPGGQSPVQRGHAGGGPQRLRRRPPPTGGGRACAAGRGGAPPAPP